MGAEKFQNASVCDCIYDKSMKHLGYLQWYNLTPLLIASYVDFLTGFETVCVKCQYLIYLHIMPSLH